MGSAGPGRRPRRPVRIDRPPTTGTPAHGWFVRRNKTSLSFGLCAVVAVLLYAGAPWFQEWIDALRDVTWPIPQLPFGW